MQINTNTTATEKNNAGEITFEVLEADFGIRDEKNRKVGGYVVIQKTTERWCRETYKMVPCTPYFSVRAQSCRDGLKYGALSPSDRCDTIEQARTWATTKLTAQAKRYAKKYAPKATTAAAA